MSDSGAKELGGEYLPFLPELDENLSPVNLPDGRRVDFSGVRLEFTRGTDMLVDGGYATIAEDNEGGQWLSPTEKLLEFMAERLKPYGGKEGGS